MRESFDLDGGAPIAPEFSHARGTRQGSVEGPDMWNQVLDNALRKPAARWEAEGIGFRLATDYRRAQKRRKGPYGSGRRVEAQRLHSEVASVGERVVADLFGTVTKFIKDFDGCEG